MFRLLTIVSDARMQGTRSTSTGPGVGAAVGATTGAGVAATTGATTGAVGATTGAGDGVDAVNPVKTRIWSRYTI